MRFIPEYPPNSVDPVLAEWAHRELTRLFAVLEERFEYGMKGTVLSVTADYSVQDYIYAVVADATSGAIAVTLPEAYPDRIVAVKKVDATNNVTIGTPNSETIDGASTKVLSTQYQSATLISDGSNWHVL